MGHQGRYSKNAKRERTARSDVLRWAQPFSRPPCREWKLFFIFVPKEASTLSYETDLVTTEVREAGHRAPLLGFLLLTILIFAIVIYGVISGGTALL
jgi:hypothetical protein